MVTAAAVYPITIYTMLFTISGLLSRKLVIFVFSTFNHIIYHIVEDERCSDFLRIKLKCAEVFKLLGCVYKCKGSSEVKELVKKEYAYIRIRTSFIHSFSRSS